MRFLLSFLLFVAAVAPLRVMGQGEHTKAHIKFEQTEYDFGEISRKGDDKSCTFRFVNDGTEPLVILSATTSCSCLKADFSRKPVAVGEGGEIVIHLESKKVDKGVFRRVVQIHSTSQGGTDILTIKGISNEL